MNDLKNENEVSTVENATLHINEEEADTTSVSSTEFNYTKETAESQTIEEDIMQLFGDYPSKDDLRKIIEKCNIILLNGKLQIYKNGIYENNTKIIRSKIFNIYSDIKPSQVNRILEGIEFELMNNDVDVKESNSNYVGFNNCVLDMQESKSYKFSPADFILTNKLGINYFPMNSVEYNSANVEVIAIYFRKVSCGNHKLEIFLYFIIGYCICRSSDFKFAFVLTGNNRNSDDGRREFLEIIDRILGKCVSYKTLRELTKSNCSLDLYGKTCNICEEVEHPNISYMDSIRKLILGKELKVNDEFKFSPFATLLINVKEILDFGNALLGLKDYFKIIPFNAKRPISKDITSELFTDSNLLYIALKSITVYNQFLRVGKEKLPVVDVVERATARYFLDNNSALDYFINNPIKGIVHKPSYYLDYCYYCVENNLKRISRANFGTEAKKFGYEIKRPSFKGKRIHCYMEADFDLQKCRADYIKYLRENGNNHTEDKDIIYENLVKFINGYGIEKSLEDIEDGTVWTGENQEFNFNFGT